MAIGSWQVSEAFDTTNSNIKYRIACLENSTSISNNSSNVRVTINIWRTNQGYTTYGSGTAYVTINGTQYTQAITSSQAITYNDYNSNYFDKTLDIPHGTDGKKTLTISAYISHDRFSSSSHSANFGMTDIPRYAKITGFTISKRDETSLTFNWSADSTIDYVWYSTNNGSNWTGVDVTDGTSGSFAVTGLNIATTYPQCKIRVRRKDSQLTTDSGAISGTTNSRPTSQVTGTSETTMSVKWTSDGTSNHIWYSLNNGSWVDVGNVNATTGTYTISGLSPGTTYNVKTLVRKSNTSGQYESANTSGATYDYPYCTEAPNFTIGNSVTIKFHNPLNRSLQIQMYSHVSGAFVTDLITVGQVTQYTFTPDANRLYSSIPNNQSSKYNIDVWYNNNKTIGDKGTSYSINTSNIKPGFSNFAYKDVGTSALTEAIANNQVIVQGVSNVNLVISSANKMTPSKNASACTSSNSKYVATFNNLSKTQAYSDNDIDVNIGVPTGNGSKVFTVTAYDSRNIPNSIPKTIDIKPYSQPEVNPSLERLNGFETATTFSVAGTFAPVTVSGTDKNQISSVKYRYKESSSSTWGAWTAMTIDSQGSGSYQTTSITLQCDNEKQFDFQFEVTDLARTVTVSRTLSVGQPLMFLHTNGILDVQNGIKSGKADGTGSFELNGSWGSQIFWKENGFGDKFRIIPEFNGADDNNKLRVQGSVGDAGTDPSLYDLMTISGKNGNLWLKGDINYFGRTFKRVTLTGGDGNTAGWRQLFSFTAGTWENYRMVLLVQSRHQGAGIVSIGISMGGDNKTLSGTPNVKYFGTETQHTDGAWRLYFNSSTGLISLYWYYSDYSPCNVIQICNDGFPDISNGPWSTSIPSSAGSTYYSSQTNVASYANSAGSANSATSATSATSASNATNIVRNGTFLSTGQACLNYNDGSGFNTSASNNGWSAPNSDWWQILHMPLSVSGYYNDICFAVNSNNLMTRQRRYNTYSGWQQILQGKNLYNNSSGTSGTITLSESASNFKYIEVFYSKNGTTGLHSVKVFTGHSMDDISCIMGYRMNDTSTQIGVSRIKISGTSLTHISNGGVNLYSNRNPETFTGNELVIKRVDGWR